MISAKRPRRKRVRDVQQSRVYNAENFYESGATCREEWKGYRKELPTATDAQAFIDATLAHPEIRATYGRSVCAKVEVYYGNRGGSADWRESRIRLGTQCRSNLIALHELAHIFVGRQFKDAVQGHGVYFCRTYLHLVRVMLGEATAGDLQAAFELFNVKFGGTDE